jgi:hypothetical protein
MKLTDNTVETALDYLAKTEEEFSKSVGRKAVVDDLQKIALSQEFLTAEGKSVADRDAAARVTERYRKAVADTEDAYTHEALMRAKRLRYEATIEVWRSLEASRRRGNV